MCSWDVPRFSVVWLWLRSDTPWPRPTPARGSKCNAVRKSALKGQSRRDRRKRIPGAARSFFHRLARAWEQSSLAGLVSLSGTRMRVPEETALGRCRASPPEGLAEEECQHRLPAHPGDAEAFPIRAGVDLFLRMFGVAMFCVKINGKSLGRFEQPNPAELLLPEVG